MEEYLELRRKARAMQPILNIGKNGITDSLILEIEKVLKARKLVKIKLNRSAIEDKDKKEIVKEIVARTGAELIDFVGFNIVLYKKN